MPATDSNISSSKEKEPNKKQSKQRASDSDPTITDLQETRNHRNRSSGSSGSRRRKPKRTKAPQHFEEWPADDQKKYIDITIHLRRWKAMQRQCLYIRRGINQFDVIRSYFSSSSEYANELATHSQTKKELVPIPADQTFDLPPFEN